MVKVIAFDLVGVLIKEKDIKLSKQEEIIEKYFGPNKSDEEFIEKIKSELNLKSKKIKDISNNIINKIYEVKDYQLLNRIKDNYPNIKIIIATNHISIINEYIKNNLDVDNIDDIIISANINQIKPNKEYYECILNKYNLNPKELLFIDDNINNINPAQILGIKTISVDKKTNIYEEIIKKITKR